MSARRVRWMMDGRPARAVEVRFGLRPDASPAVEIHVPDRRSSITITGAELLRDLIADLQFVAPHMAVANCEARSESGARCELPESHSGAHASPAADFVPLSRRQKP